MITNEEALRVATELRAEGMSKREAREDVEYAVTLRKLTKKEAGKILDCIEWLYRRP